MSERGRILVVDDEKQNAQYLSTILESEGFHSSVAENGMEGIKLLGRNPDQLPLAIVLDWNMPVMNGMEFLKSVKASSLYQHIPVVMQTANANPEYLVAAIQQGVFYFLAKPFDYRIFKTVVEAAVRECERARDLLSDLHLDRGIRSLIDRGVIHFSTLAEAETVSGWLASHAKTERRIPVLISIKELLINAIEHGNLGITYDQKTDLVARSALQEEIERRLGLPENAGKKVRLEFERKNFRMNLEIFDQGEGFDFDKFLKLRPERFMDMHGNGIAMACINLSEVRYLSPGNRVVTSFDMARFPEKM